MKEPIKAGDLAEVINGLLGKSSPNLGLIVKVVHRVYECPQLGVIWRCEAQYAIRQADRPNVPAGLADFAQDWLRKIEPPPLKAKEVAEGVPTMREQLIDEHASGLDG